jgi:hypothetical protein
MTPNWRCAWWATPAPCGARRCRSSPRARATAPRHWPASASAHRFRRTGELDFAVGTLRDTASRLDALPTRGIFLAFSLGSLATAHLFRSDAGAAREALARAAPLIVRYDLGSRYAATAACLAAQERRWPAVAMLLGYGQAASSVSGVDAEEPAELRARARAMQELAANATAAEADAWMVAGSALETEAAYALALEQAEG